MSADVKALQSALERGVHGPVCTAQQPISQLDVIWLRGSAIFINRYQHVSCIFIFFDVFPYLPCLSTGDAEACDLNLHQFPLEELAPSSTVSPQLRRRRDTQQVPGLVPDSPCGPQLSSISRSCPSSCLLLALLRLLNMRDESHHLLYFGPFSPT